MALKSIEEIDHDYIDFSAANDKNTLFKSQFLAGRIYGLFLINSVNIQYFH